MMRATFAMLGSMLLLVSCADDVLGEGSDLPGRCAERSVAIDVVREISAGFLTRTDRGFVGLEVFRGSTETILRHFDGDGPEILEAPILRLPEECVSNSPSLFDSDGERLYLGINCTAAGDLVNPAEYRLFVAGDGSWTPVSILPTLSNSHGGTFAGAIDSASNTLLWAGQRAGMDGDALTFEMDSGFPDAPWGMPASFDRSGDLHFGTRYTFEGGMRNMVSVANRGADDACTFDIEDVPAFTGRTPPRVFAGQDRFWLQSGTTLVELNWQDRE